MIDSKVGKANQKWALIRHALISAYLRTANLDHILVLSFPIFEAT